MQCDAFNHDTARRLAYTGHTKTGLERTYEEPSKRSVVQHAVARRFPQHHAQSERVARRKRDREVVVAVTGSRLDFGPWEQIFYGEFDGRRNKRLLVKIIGD